MEIIAPSLEEIARECGLDAICLANVEPEDISWLWPGRIPLGKVITLTGDPGVGKSFISAWLATQISIGAPIPGQSECFPTGKSIFMCCEDNLADTFRPRVDAMGGDPNQVISLKGSFAKLDQKESGPICLRRDEFAKIRMYCERVPDIKLIVIDPISAYLGKIDSNNNTDVRGILDPIAEWAGTSGVTVLMVNHLNKGKEQSALQRGIGSIAFNAVARLVYNVTNQRGKRLMSAAKWNCGPKPDSTAFRISEDGELLWDLKSIATTADDAVGFTREPSDEAKAAEWLKSVLANGKVESAVLEKAAVELGFSDSTLQRARTSLGIKPRKEKNKWFTALPLKS
jgi:putative DNA primase/helicase